ncbi:MAG: 2-C-methyl-D-erythritol 4-phosphate cytidylyltransferase [Chitinophagaceae bacterium]|nr:2-C-methyl-D-erythritol 4-phosphate cytidylyltransferase [Chitinophagaceae bacterium]MCW5929839.1 2-C-methyl-D-erythritol 4-phosphate cytidylyltransferase [Chitinophagaceae bacterium]
MKKYAVIVAGGSGSRMKTATPKQFLLLNNKPVIFYTIEVFLKAFADLQIILVLPAGFAEDGDLLTDLSSDASRIQVVAGGDTRFDSVKKGLEQVKEESIVFVHDGVRCLVTTALIQSCYAQALEKGSAIPAIPVTDSVRVLTAKGSQPLNRDLLRAVQTPQTFRSTIILKAFEQPYRAAFTDEATVAEAAGFEVFLIEGDKRNIKITLPEDLLIAENLLASGRD